MVFGELPKRARNFQGRLIREKGTSAWVDLIPTAFSEVKSFLYIGFDEELKIQGKTSKIHQGLHAIRFRENNGMSDEKYLEKLAEKLANYAVSELAVENRTAVNKNIQ
ncbi:MAG: hypothetical protein ABGW63_04385, partial [Flavobacteriaceae bacterium]